MIRLLRFCLYVVWPVVDHAIPMILAAFRLSRLP